MQNGWKRVSRIVFGSSTKINSRNYPRKYHKSIEDCSLDEQREIFNNIITKTNKRY